MAYNGAGATVVQQHNRKNAQQDRFYGKGMRVFNPCKTGSDGTDYRCTVCGTNSSGGNRKRGVKAMMMRDAGVTTYKE